jgi:hypothetical protein
MRVESRLSPISILAWAVALGLVVGLGSVAVTSQGRLLVTTKANDLAIRAGWKRKREPIAGDQWGGCYDARAAGTAPIYRGEPGYRPEMDGDGDGVACEAPRW